MASNNILISFDMLFDIDFGLIRMIKNEKYNKLGIFKNGILYLKDLLLVQILTERKEENPLSIALYDEYKYSQDNLYKQFIEKKYDSILKYTKPTELLNLMSVYKKTNLINVTVLCKNKQQEQFINLYKRFATITESVLSNLNINDYDTLYFKYFKNVSHIKNLIGKNLYIANYKFNLNNDNILPKSSIRENLSDALNVSVIDTYNKEKFKDIKG